MEDTFKSKVKIKDNIYNAIIEKHALLDAEKRLISYRYKIIIQDEIDLTNDRCYDVEILSNNKTLECYKGFNNTLIDLGKVKE